MKKISISLLAILFSIGSYAQLLTGVNEYKLQNPEKDYPIESVFKNEKEVTLKKVAIIEYRFEKEELQKIYLNHTIKKVQDPSVLDNFNKYYLPIGNSNELLAFEARVINDGKIGYKGTKSDIKTLEEENRKINIIALEGVKVGSVVEIFFKVKLLSNVYGTEYLQQSSPIQNAQFSVITPEHLVMNTKAYNSNSITKIDTISKGRRFVNYSENNLIGLEKDKYAFLDCHKLRIEYTFGENLSNNRKGSSYPEIGANYYGNLIADADKEAKTVNKVIKDLKLGSNQEENIWKIEQFVKNSVQYATNAESEMVISKVQKNKYGNQFTMLRYFLLLFDAANIKHEMIIVAEREDYDIDPEFPTYTTLDDILLYFPSVKMYMSPTYYGQRLGALPPEYCNQNALVIKPTTISGSVKGIGNIKKLPCENGDKHLDNINVTAKFIPEKLGLDVNYQKAWSGYPSLIYRNIHFFSDEKDKKEFIENVVKTDDEKIDFVSIKAINGDINDLKEFRTPFTINANYLNTQLVEKAGADFVLNIGMLIGKQVEMYQEKPRVLPIDIQYPHIFKRVLKIELPAGYVATNPEIFNMNIVPNIDGKPVGFTSVAKVDGNTITITCEEFYHEVSMPLSTFEDFRKVINAAADFNKLSLIVKKN